MLARAARSRRTPTPLAASMTLVAIAACSTGGDGASAGAGGLARSSGSASRGQGGAASNAVASTTGRGAGAAGGASTHTTTAATGGPGGASGSAVAGGAGGSGGKAGGGPPTAAELLALTATCKQVSNGDYGSSEGDPASIPVCGLNGAFFYHSGMAIDCDGKTTPQCNLTMDPAYQNQTSATDSQGNPLDSAALPYVVLPLAGGPWDHGAAGVQLGAVVAVIYQGQLVYGVFGDEGPNDIIGEASYALASLLGIDPNPSTGGTNCCDVTYVVFSGAGALVSPIENHAAAVTLGQALAAELLKNN